MNLLRFITSVCVSHGPFEMNAQQTLLHKQLHALSISVLVFIDALSTSPAPTYTQCEGIC